MAFVAGKNARVLLGGFDLSGYLKNVSVQLTKDALDTTTFTDSSRDFIEGLKTGTASLSGLFDGADDMQDEQLFTAFGSGTVTNALIAPGGLTIGDVGYAGRIWDAQYEEGATFDGLTTFGGSLQVDGGWERSRSLHALGAETTTGAYANIDDGASSSAGAAAYIFVTAQSGAAATVKVQHAPMSAGVYADLITFSSLSGVSSSRGTAAGSVDRYVRANLTSASTSITFQVSFVRL